jgi:alpha-tubulin suppressor-like RCC1 family protein
MNYVSWTWVGFATFVLVAGCESDTRVPLDTGVDVGDTRETDAGQDTAQDGGEDTETDPPIRWRHVSAGNTHACGITEDFRVTCWGSWRDFAEGQIPAGTMQMVVADRRWDCSLDSAGTIDCWGEKKFTGRLNPPEDEEGDPLGGFTDLDISQNHACAAGGPHNIRCWGLGSEKDEREGFNDYDQSVAPEGTAYTKVAAGYIHTCAIRADDGTIDCWGAGDDPDENTGGSDYDQSVPPEGEYVDIDAHQFRSCALSADGAIDCWGREGFGTPPEGKGYSSLSVGYTHSCALDEQGEITCWGNEADGAKDVGDGPWRQVAAGTRLTCALGPPENSREGGRIECWGRNDHRQLEVPE